MKLVSRRWVEIKDVKEQTEKYEYLSLRDREAYAELKRFWDDKTARTQLEELLPRKRAPPMIGEIPSMPDQ